MQHDAGHTRHTGTGTYRTVCPADLICCARCVFYNIKDSDQGWPDAQYVRGCVIVSIVAFAARLLNFAVEDVDPIISEITQLTTTLGTRSVMGHDDDDAGSSCVDNNNATSEKGPMAPIADGSVFDIGEGPKGRGLFASTDIPPRYLIHVAPCVPILKDEYDRHMKHTVLEHYLFNDARSGNKLLALGYGSLFNHSSHPNVDYRVNSEELSIEYRSGFQTIPKDEELCISYGSNLWFEDAERVGPSTESSDGDDEKDGVAAFLGRIEVGDSDYS